MVEQRIVVPLARVRFPLGTHKHQQKDELSCPSFVLKSM